MIASPVTGARYRRPDPSAVRLVTGPAGVPLRVWTSGVSVPVVVLEPDAADRLAAGCAALVQMGGAGAGFPAVYADRLEEHRFRERHDLAMRAVVVTAAGRVLADLTRGREFVLGRAALHEWFVAIGALRLLDGRGAVLGSDLVSLLQDRIAQVLLPDLGRAVDREPRRRSAWARSGWSVALGLVLAVLAVIGATEPVPRALAPEHSAPALPAPVVEGLLAVSSPQLDRLHDAGLHVAPTTCTLPALGTSNESAEAWVQASVTCLDDAWRPVLTAAGVPARRPAVRRYRDQILTRCLGDQQTSAFYCGADELIGVSPSTELRQVSERERAGWLLGVMAHEYGHHVQGLTGTLAAVVTQQQDHPPGGPSWLELNRREELQANCFAGVALAAMTGRGSVGAAETAGARTRLSGGDDGVLGGARDHGTTGHNRQWFDRGLQTGSPAACNTWIVPAVDVE